MNDYEPAERLAHDLIKDIKRLDLELEQEYELLSIKREELDEILKEKEIDERMCRIINIMKSYEERITKEIQLKYNNLIEVIKKGFNFKYDAEKESLKIFKECGKTLRKKKIFIDIPSYLEPFKVQCVMNKINRFIDYNPVI